jgi:predicted metal-dependent hydrolase
LSTRPTYIRVGGNTVPVTLAAGLDQMRAEQWFAAHESFETEWRDAPDAERDFLQGFVHVTVAWHHASGGNAAGAAGQLEKAASRLGPYAPEHRGVRVDRVLGQVQAARARVAEGLLDLLPVRI